MPNQTLYDNFSQVRQYIDQEKPDLSSYVSKSELAACSYVTSSDLPVIDESIVPNTTATYTLGDESHLYSATYSARLKVGNNSQIYNDGGGITLSVNNNAGIRMGSSNLYPKTNKGYSNGSSTNYWNSTYTSRVDLNSNIALTSDGSGLFITTAGNLKFSFDTDSFHPYGSTYSGALDLGTSTRTWRSTYTNDLYLGSQHIRQDEYSIGFQINGNNTMRMFVGSFRPWTDKGATLGSSTNMWSTTYTSNIYADNAYISNYNNLIWTGTSAEYAALSDYTTYQFYLIENE